MTDLLAGWRKLSGMCGKRVAVQTQTATFVGTLNYIGEGKVALLADGAIITIPFEHIADVEVV